MYLLSVAVIVGIAIIAAGVRSRAAEASIWLAVMILGEAATLLLIDAGSTVHYQHLRSLRSMWSDDFKLPFTLLLAQAVVVGARLLTKKSSLSPIIFSARKIMRPFRWAILIVLLIVTSATLSREPRLYLEEIILASCLQFLVLATLLLFVMSLPEELVTLGKEWSTRFFTNSGHRRIDRFFIRGALFVTVLSAALSVIVYQRHPHIPDEVSYLLHARYFAHGMLSMPASPVPAAFDLDLMMQEPNRWYSPFPPGWPAILALGMIVGVPWLVNPLLAGVNVLLACLIVEQMYDNRTARIVCVLLCVSPWHVFMAMNFMSHTASLTCLLAAVLAVQRMRQSGNIWWSIPGGVALGVLSLIRPLDGFTIALVLGLWSIGARGRGFRLAPSFALALVTTIVGSLQLAYNAALTGSPAVFPVNRYFDVTYGPGVNDLGFGPNRGIGWGFDPFPGHGFRDVLVNANLNVTAINTELFGWGIGSVALIAMIFLSKKANRNDYNLAFLIVSVVAMQSLYWFSGGPDFGARYWYPVILPCVILAFRGFDWIVSQANLVAQDGLGGTRIAFGLGALILAGIVTFIPWRAVDKYFHYRGMRPDIRAMSALVPFGRSVVFVRGNRQPDYASAAVYNSIDVKGESPVFVWDKNREVREKVLATYPDRPVWFVDGPTVTGSGFQIVGGPLQTSKAAAFASGGLGALYQTHP
jgi:hypothetical protein